MTIENESVQSALPTESALAVSEEQEQEQVEEQSATEVQSPVAAPSWEAKRLAKKTAELERVKAELLAERAKRGTSASPVDPQLVEEEVSRRLAEKDFNDRANAAAVAGRDQFGATEFNASVANLLTLIDRDNTQEQQQYNSFIAAALETGEAPRLVYLLGQDLETAERIMALSPVKQGIELARLAAKDIPALSKAPKPITPIKSVGARHEEIDPRDAVRADKLSTAEWMKRREAQIRANSSR